jgi:hypothetical protein
MSTQIPHYNLNGRIYGTTTLLDGWFTMYWPNCHCIIITKKRNY